MMPKNAKTDDQDELFFDQLKDQFAFFYAVTVSAMEAMKKARANYQKKMAEEQKGNFHKDGD